MSRRRSTAPPPIRVVGARTHNLKNVSVSIPQGELTVVTGVSGSGKSSLAFDTLYAEGQRRYAESLSTYARQFLERLDRPDVDSIEPVPPAIALEQKNGVTNARSTVGTQTEVADALRLLFAHAGTTFCPEEGTAAERGSLEYAAAQIAAEPAGTRMTLYAPVRLPPEDGDAALLLAELSRGGYFRALDPSGGPADLPPEASAARALADGEGRLRVVTGRFLAGRADPSEIAAAAEAALGMAGEINVRSERGGETSTRVFRRGLFCPVCGRQFREPTPALFAFNSPLGACGRCQGFGRVIGIDMDKVVPNRDLTLDERPIAPWNTPAYESAYKDLFRACRKHGVRRHVAYGRLTSRERSVVEKGTEGFYGIGGFFEWLETKRYKVHVRILLSRYRAYTPCPECGATRLNPEALRVRFRGRTLPELSALPIGELSRWFDAQELSPSERERVGSVVAEIRSRLAYLVDVGLEYLTLSRAARTLSGGEAQRIGLASALGSALTRTLYVLDEPTIGLHPRDTRRLIAILRQLSSRGNTVVVVEHDPEVIRAAGRVIDLGPGAGVSGGSVLYEGDAAGLLRAPESRTGQMLRQAPVPPAPGNVVAFRRGADAAITIVGAREHNLRHLTVRLPLGRLVAVTGVSGSGKSTLLEECFFHVYQRRVKGIGTVDAGAVDELRGLENVEDVFFVDQSPLGRSARSNPVTYTKAYDEVRRLFAETGRARAFRVTARDFSFNTPGGRCEACQGTGVVTVDMQFLADVVVTCDRCEGQRFSSRVLGIRYRGRNVDDVLRMTVAEAMEFFADTPRLTRRLAPLREVGLSYLPLGQPTATLSGGEAQRLKLASFLEDRPARGKGALFVFDEPTTGLHLADVEVLLATFRKLIARGHSVVAIEHHMDFVAACDWVIDLGPGGGEEGGRLVAEGTPAEIARSAGSHTGAFLAARLAAPRREARATRTPRLQ